MRWQKQKRHSDLCKEIKASHWVPCLTILHFRIFAEPSLFVVSVCFNFAISHLTVILTFHPLGFPFRFFNYFRRLYDCEIALYHDGVDIRIYDSAISRTCGFAVSRFRDLTILRYHDFMIVRFHDLRFHDSAISCLYSFTISGSCDYKILRCHNFTILGFHDFTSSWFSRVLRFQDFTISRFHDFTILQVRDFGILRLHGFLILGSRGFTVTWFHDLTISWFHDLTVSWFYDFTIPRSHDHGFSRIQDLVIARFLRCRDFAVLGFCDFTSSRFLEVAYSWLCDFTSTRFHDCVVSRLQDFAISKLYEFTTSCLCDFKVLRFCDFMFRDFRISWLLDLTISGFHCFLVYGFTTCRLFELSKDLRLDVEASASRRYYFSAFQFLSAHTSRTVYAPFS